MRYDPNEDDLIFVPQPDDADPDAEAQMHAREPGSLRDPWFVSDYAARIWREGCGPDGL